VEAIGDPPLLPRLGAHELLEALDHPRRDQPPDPAAVDRQHAKAIGMLGAPSPLHRGALSAPRGSARGPTAPAAASTASARGGRSPCRRAPRSPAWPTW